MKQFLNGRMGGVLQCAIALLCLLCVTTSYAHQFPDRPLRILVGFGQGGPTDVVARVLAEQMSREIGQRVFVENRPGASGNIATQALVNAESDGYTYMIGATPFAINHTLFPDFKVKFGPDVAAIASIGSTTNALVVNPALGVRDLSGFLSLARSRPEETISYVTLGRGASSHLAGIELDRLAGVRLLAVAYRGNGEALQDLLAGHVNAWFAPVPSVSELVKSGNLIALGVTGPTRSASLPDAPTLDESGLKGFDVRLWVGLFARAGIPADVQGVFDRALEKAMNSGTYKATLDAQGIEPFNMTRSEFAKFIDDEISRWRPVIEKLK